MSTSAPLRLSAEDKLDVLRKLDCKAPWASLDDQRYCTRCDRVISGRQIEVAGGTRAHGPLRLECPTSACVATPDDWTTPSDAATRRSGVRSERSKTIRDNGVHNAGYVEIRAESEDISITHDGRCAVVQRKSSGRLSPLDQASFAVRSKPRFRVLRWLIQNIAAVASDGRSVLRLLQARRRTPFHPVQ